MSARVEVPVVAVVDSGVHADHPHIRESGRVVHLGEIDADGRLVRDSAATDVLGHGTAVAAAILDLCPGIVIQSIRVFAAEPVCSLASLARALMVAAEHGAHLVNLSVGTTRPEGAARLEAAVRACLDRGARLVAPASDSGLPSYPGMLAGVTAVLSDPNVARGEVRERVVRGRTFLVAAPWARELPGLPRDLNLRGESLATANATGYLARDLRT